jgi:hypothetical protein
MTRQIVCRPKRPLVPRQHPNAVLNTAPTNNGGPTVTHELPAGSPAIDKVNDRTRPPPTRGRRGVTRLRDGNGDGGRPVTPGRLNGNDAIDYFRYRG